MGMNGVNAAMTKLALAGLRRRAYTVADFERLVAGTPFRTAEITTDGIGLDVRLTKLSEGEAR